MIQETIPETQMQDTTKGLRELADFMESHPDINLGGWMCLNLFVNTREELADMARKVGTCQKKISGDYYFLQRDFGGGVTLEINCSRDKVCAKVSKGKKIVPAKPERVLPAEPEQEIEEFEYVCPDSLLSESV
jgi:hypothetical protein